MRNKIIFVDKQDREFINKYRRGLFEDVLKDVLQTLDFKGQDMIKMFDQFLCFKAREVEEILQKSERITPQCVSLDSVMKAISTIRKLPRFDERRPVTF